MNKSLKVGAIAASLLLASSQAALASTITFDEFAAGNTNAAITALYAPLGITFGADNSGTWGGMSQGNPGRWSLEGTNGSAFLGNNGINNGNAYTTSVFFTGPVSDVSFDVSRSNGSVAGQSLIASVFSGTTLLSSQSILLGAINSWTSIAFGLAGISSLVITGSSAGFSPFGIDNLAFGNIVSGIGQLPVEVTAIPEPGTYAMLLAGLGLLGFVARRRTARPQAGTHDAALASAA